MPLPTFLYLYQCLRTCITTTYEKLQTITDMILGVPEPEEEEEEPPIPYDEFLLSRMETNRRKIRWYIQNLGELPMVEVKLFRCGMQEVERLRKEYVYLGREYRQLLQSTADGKADE